jgi:WD40 repeat protein
LISHLNDDAIKIKSIVDSPNGIDENSIEYSSLLQNSENLQKLIDENQSRVSALEADISSREISLISTGCLAGNHRFGVIDNTLHWLNSRSFGVTSSTLSGGLSVSKHPSNSLSSRRIINSFRHLWEASGHSQYPTYCSVFDKTGNFVITGADDFLIKVWDVEKGNNFNYIILKYDYSSKY